MNYRVILLLCGLLLTVPAYASERQLPVEAQMILDDLGPPEVQEANNGKTFSCREGGDKTILISPLADATMFSGDYRRCKENGTLTDGYYEFIVRDWELVGQSQRPSLGTQLVEAVKNDDLAMVRKLIAEKANPNYTESMPRSEGGSIEGWTPLMTAVVNGKTEMVKVLVEGGAWVNYLNSSAVNALWLAAGSGHLEIVKFLVSRGAYVNNSNSEEVTPLMLAAMNGHLGVARFLIKSGAHINSTHKDGDTALMFALANKHSAVARLLLQSGADVNIRNRHGVSALVIAVSENNEALVAELLKRGADPTIRVSDDKTLLDIAIIRGNAKIQKLLSRK